MHIWLPANYDTWLLQLHQVYLSQHDTTWVSWDPFLGLLVFWVVFLASIITLISLRLCICRHIALRKPFYFELYSFTIEHSTIVMTHGHTSSKNIKSAWLSLFFYSFAPCWFSSTITYFPTTLCEARWKFVNEQISIKIHPF